MIGSAFEPDSKLAYELHTLQRRMPMGCIDENAVFDFLAGRLEGDALRSVEQHIDGCDDCRLLVAYTSVKSSARASDGPILPSLPHVGELVGERFRLARLIGWGGTGLVYEAVDEYEETPVALRLLNVAQANRERLSQKLAHDLAIVRRIRHPNVCRVDELGLDEPRPYISMELLRGKTLSEHGLEVGRERKILCSIAAALEAAHAVGVAHGDLKAENVMIGDDARVVVMDFGLYRDESEWAGAPAHWAPERARSGLAGPAQDVYAFGVLAQRFSRVEHSLTRACLSQVPAKRPTATELKSRLERAESGAGRWFSFDWLRSKWAR